MFTRLKISVVLLPVALIALVGIYVYSLWAGERQRAADVPVEATGMMIRDLLAYHKNRGSFPSDLKQLEGVIWDKKREREFSLQNRALSHHHYFYLYTFLTPHRFTLWAVPMGPAREVAATLFVSGTPGASRSWKGAALSHESVDGIKADPSEIELGSLGLVEQPRLVTQGRSK